MKITYTPYLKKKYSANNFGTIQIRRTENRKSTYFSLGETIKTKFWLKTGSVSSTHPDFIELNKNIENKINELKRKDIPDTLVVANIVEEEELFIEFFNSQLIYLQSRREIGSYKSHKTSYLHFTTFLETKNIKKLYFKGITSSLMRDFETYLLELGLSINSCIKYIKTIKNVFNKGVALDKFNPIKNPFITLNKKTTPVSKKTLGRKEIEMIIKTPIDKDSPLYHYKNYFLFQIFAQGIRVSDLMTLRWGNLITGEIIINQFKTKTLHKIRLNVIVLLRLADYFPKGLKIVNNKYKFNLNNVDYSMNYKEVEEYYNKLQKANIGLYIQLNMSENDEDKKKLNELEKMLKSWLDIISKISEKIKAELIIEISIYGKANPKQFVFPILDDKIFSDIEFNAQKHILSKYQYNQLSSKTAYYNKQLKKLQELCQIEIVFTSHLARHSYTNLMIETTNKDIYTISKSLGHSSLSTTQHYVNEFLYERINESNDEMNQTFLTKS
ncbi:MAG: integrase [Flavobacterium sp.]|jgi:integrase